MRGRGRRLGEGHQPDRPRRSRRRGRGRRRRPTRSGARHRAPRPPRPGHRPERRWPRCRLVPIGSMCSCGRVCRAHRRSTWQVLTSPGRPGSDISPETPMRGLRSGRHGRRRRVGCRGPAGIPFSVRTTPRAARPAPGHRASPAGGRPVSSRTTAASTDPNTTAHGAPTMTAGGESPSHPPTGAPARRQRADLHRERWRGDRGCDQPAPAPRAERPREEDERDRRHRDGHGEARDRTRPRRPPRRRLGVGEDLG